MRLPGWICVVCEKPFTRRWNAQRHVSMQHPDESAEFVTLVDYLAGRLSGVYMASSRMRAPPPNLGQVRPGTNIFDFLQHVSPSHAAQYTKQPVAAVQARKRATHLQDILHIFEPHERYKQGESLTQSMTREFGLELARQSARNVTNQQIQRPVSATPEQLRLTHFSSNFLIPAGNQNAIFGFRGHMCSKCLMKEHLAVSYSIDNHTDARVEVKHYCRPDLLAYNQNLDDKVRASSVELMRNTLPSYLKKVVNLWTGEEVVLLAIELPGESPPTSEPTANDRIRIPYPRNPKTSITFHRSMEKQVELNQGHGGTGNPNHWSSRVIRQGRTRLTQDELEEFLKMQNATFGIYKIHVGNKDNCNDIHNKSPPQQQQKQDWTQQRPTRCYFMYLRKLHETSK
ncbi:MAG: hypothetical protein WAZ77_22415 [Candidatus Nitrosopolaris sp.]